MNYATAAAAAAHGTPVQPAAALRRGVHTAPLVSKSREDNEVEPKKRAPSPSHVPRTASPESDVYVLTLMTDKPHHERMTQLRKKYFPPKLNRLAAHLTLFHALPGSRLESHILPHIRTVASQTRPFDVHASTPFRMKKGFAISVPRNKGGAAGWQVHQRLQEPWLQEGFLSDQDAGGCRLHYTIMNKVDDEQEVNQAFEEVSQQYREDIGTVTGLLLWRYDRGNWRMEKQFDFGDSDR